MNSNFVEEFIFTKYKDSSIGNAEKFKGLVKKKWKDVDAGEIYRRIVNYQIKKYGSALSAGTGERIPIKRLRHIVENREHRRRKRLGIEKNDKLRRWSE